MSLRQKQANATDRLATVNRTDFARMIDHVFTVRHSDKSPTKASSLRSLRVYVVSRAVLGRAPDPLAPYKFRRFNSFTAKSAARAVSAMYVSDGF